MINQIILSKYDSLQEKAASFFHLIVVGFGFVGNELNQEIC